MYDFKNFTLSDMTHCQMDLRKFGATSKTMEETSNKIVRYFYDNFIDSQTGEHNCVLVRLFKTYPYSDLNERLRVLARNILSAEPEDKDFRCLTLMATSGEKMEWNNRKLSSGHQAIPLQSEKFVLSFPMISNLIKQLGLEISQVVKPDPGMILDLNQKTY
ncbi:MAG: hypothetical protein A2231_00800, partial [Candidatus Firestonebacteria bacterium RIFOXYA2_FULL_40_8]